MIKSMTGFGRGEAEGWVTELRSVNHRFGEFAFRIPRHLSSLESRFKEEIKKNIRRGRLEVKCSLESSQRSEGLRITLDENVADQIYGLLNSLNERFGFQQKVDLSLLASFRDIFRNEEESPDLEKIWESLLPSLKDAVESLDGMRQAEGENLQRALKESLTDIEAIHQKLTDRAPRVVEAYHERLSKRLQTFNQGDALDEQRLLQEVVLFSDRSDITEELTRLQSHLLQSETTLEGAGPHGKRLEFLLQEMNREVNTIGSKGNDIKINQWVVECKCELEKMREQIQNVE